MEANKVELSLIIIIISLYIIYLYYRYDISILIFFSYKFLEYWGHNVSPDEEYVPGRSSINLYIIILIE